MLFGMIIQTLTNKSLFEILTTRCFFKNDINIHLNKVLIQSKLDF